jgi:hypothetical protein
MQFKISLIELLKSNNIGNYSTDIKGFSDFELIQFDDKNLLFNLLPQNIQLSETASISSLQNWANENQFRLIHLFEDEYITNPDLVKNRILSLWRIRTKINARSCIVKKINKIESDDFLNAHHSMGTSGAAFRFGLFHMEELVAVATFGKPKTMLYEDIPYYSYVWERFASCSDKTVIGGMGKLLKAFLTSSGAKHIMTYADINWGSGEAFLKLGFKEVARLNYDSFSNKKLNQSFDKNVLSFGSIKYILDLR